MKKTNIFFESHDDEFIKETDVVADVKSMPSGQEDQSNCLRKRTVAKKF
jgi:hypothetical protein